MIARVVSGLTLNAANGRVASDQRCGSSATNELPSSVYVTSMMCRSVPEVVQRSTAAGPVSQRPGDAAARHEPWSPPAAKWPDVNLART